MDYSLPMKLILCFIVLMNCMFSSLQNNEEVQLDMVASREKLSWLTWPDGVGWQIENMVINGSRLYYYFICNVNQPDQDNWLRTNLMVLPPTVTQVFVEMKFAVRDCSSFDTYSLSCRETFHLYVSETDADVTTDFHKDQFHKLDTMVADEVTDAGDLRITTETRAVDGLSRKGFYLAFQDTGACVFITFLRVYYKTSPASPKTVAVREENQTPEEVTRAQSTAKVLYKTAPSAEKLGWLKIPEKDGWNIGPIVVNGSLSTNIVTCDLDNTQPHRWTRSPFILRPPTVTQVFVEMKFSVVFCIGLDKGSTGCTKNFNLYISEADADVGTFFSECEFLNVGNIVAEKMSSAEEERINTVTRVVDNLSRIGFYVAFQETGSCLSIRSVRVYYKTCSATAKSLTGAPETEASEENRNPQDVQTYCIADGEQVVPVNEN